jgi:hypothetical protein
MYNVAFKYHGGKTVDNKHYPWSLPDDKYALDRKMLREDVSYTLSDRSREAALNTLTDSKTRMHFESKGSSFHGTEGVNLIRLVKDFNLDGSVYRHYDTNYFREQAAMGQIDATRSRRMFAPDGLQTPVKIGDYKRNWNYVPFSGDTDVPGMGYGYSNFRSSKERRSLSAPYKQRQSPPSSPTLKAEDEMKHPAILEPTDLLKRPSVLSSMGELGGRRQRRNRSDIYPVDPNSVGARLAASKKSIEEQKVELKTVEERVAERKAHLSALKEKNAERWSELKATNELLKSGAKSAPTKSDTQAKSDTKLTPQELKFA